MKHHLLRGPLALSAALLLGACSTTGPAQPTTPEAPRAVAAPSSKDLSPQARMTLQAPGSALALDPMLRLEPPASPEATPQVTDPLQPDRVLNLGDQQAETDLWARVRRGYGMADLNDDLVRRAEQHYASKPDYVRRMTERGGRYLFHILEEVEKRNMPTELALLPFIESAFNPQAMSSARASGMWQFMPLTGKDYALKQNIFRDDRRDVLASTRAALDYLGRLYNMFGDWHLALAAYNWGEGNVQRAIARNQKAGLPTDYSSLRMPDETRYYVPKLQAVKNIVSQPEGFALSLSPLKNHPYFVSVPIGRDIDVELAARLAGVPLEEFRHLNPQMNKPVILAAGTEQVLLPYENASRFLSNLRSHQGQLASWTAWVAPKTLRPADAAKQVGMSEAQLRDINRIPPRMLVKAGSTLLVPRTAGRNADVSEHLAENATMALAPDVPPTRRVVQRAGKRGESVASVARRNGVSAAQVAQWNGLSASGSFKPGASIVLNLPNRSSAHPATATRSVKPTSGRARR